MEKKQKTMKLTKSGYVPIAVVAVIVTALIILLSISDAGQETDDSRLGGTITYYPGDGVYQIRVTETSGERSVTTDGVATSVVVSSYQGIKSTEYNPEYWSGTGEIGSGVRDWQGPAQELIWSEVSSVTLTVEFTARGTDGKTGKYIVTMPEGITITAATFDSDSDSSFTDVSFGQSGGRYYFQVLGGTENKMAIVNLTATYDTTVNINKVFGGWKERSYTISFNGNESTSGTMESEKAVAYHKYTLPLCEFEKTGYIFAGWSVTGYDDLKYPGDEVAISQDTAIIAFWLESTYAGAEYYKVTFQHDSTDLIDPLFVKKGYQFVLPENTTTIESKVFTSWIVGTKEMSPGQKISISENTAITAKTETSTASYVVTLAKGNGETASTFNIKAGNGYVLPHCDFSIAQKSTFRIWAVESPDGSVSYYYPGETVHIAGETLITAIWFDNIIYPGEVVDWSVTELEAVWVVPNLYIGKSLTIPKDNAWDKKVVDSYCECTLNPTNVDRLDVFELKPYRMLLTNTKNSEASNLGTISDDDYYKLPSSDGNTAFTTINYLRHYGATIRITDIPMGTYRTVDPHINTDIGKASRTGSEKYAKAEISFSNVQLHANNGSSNDVIIDNVNIRGGSNGKHGDGNDGLFANGNRLILGTKITVPQAEASDAKLTSDQSGSSSIFLTVYGGGKSNITKAVDTKRMVFGRSDSSMEEMVNVGTFMIIHSGIYFNIVGGGANSSNIGSNSVLLSTYLVLKGCIVTDTIVGGSGSSSKSTVGNIYGSLSSGTREVGGTFTYALGLYSLGDYWQDSTSGYLTSGTPSGNIRKNIVTSESSVVEGGCSKGHVFGSTHLFISGRSSVWDVQAGGRTHYTISDYAYLEITGDAEVRRVACGTITDGNNSNSSRNTVDFANIYVGGNTKVATVYGAGFDTWCYPKSSSMTEGKILVEITGGKIHDVFGGGYRGSIGTPNSGGVDNTDKLSITVKMTGGEVLGNVYGGGSGGLNKMKHNTAGAGFQNSSEGQDGNRKSTGKSYVYGNITVDISGGTVDGNVYGGGMSVPVLSYYGNIHDGSATGALVTDFATNEVDEQGNPCYVAAVIGPVNVKVSDDAEIKGSVFGAGKGIVLDSHGNVDKSEYGFNWVLSKTETDNMMKMYWADFGSTGYGYNESATLSNNYQEYAKVQGTVRVYIQNNTNEVEGGVYGGGGYSKVYGNIAVDIDSGKVNNDVFAGGLGTLGKTSTTGTRLIYVEGDSKIVGSVYGGSRAGDDKRDGSILLDCDATVVVSRGTISGSVFGGGLKGETHGSTNVYIGYYLQSLDDSSPAINPPSGDDVVIKLDSVYAGGNVVTDETEHIEAYTETLVLGNGKVWVDGTNTSMDIRGAIMASGNSCLTGAEESCETGIYISNFSSKSSLTGIHRAKEVTISNSSMTITGRNPITPVAGQIKSLSIYNVDILKVQNNTTIALVSPVDDVDEINSLYSSGGFTTESSPSNRFVFASGTTVYIRHIDYDESDDSYTFNYGAIKGYIAMTAMNQESYGAYAIAKTSLEGGFSYITDGIYKETETSVSEDSCCWFISGIQKKVLTMELQIDDNSSQSTESFIDLNKFQTDTNIVFTGGAFTKMSNDEKGQPYKFVRPDVDEFENEANLALMLAYNVSGSPVPVLYDPSPHNVNLGNGKQTIEGTFYYKGNVDEEPVSEEYSSLISNPMETESSNKSGIFRIYMTLVGKPLDSTEYVGYLLLNFQEVKIITYETVGPGGKIVKATKTLVSNTIELRIDIYLYGSAGIDENNRFSVEVKTDVDADKKRDGESSTLIPKQYKMADTNVVDVSIAGNNDVTRSSGSNYTLPNNQFTAPEGKVFAGWLVSSGSGDPVLSEPGCVDTAGINEYIVPKWETKDDDVYTIQFDANGGSGVMKTYEAKSGIDYIIPECSFKMSGGKHFLRWVMTIGSEETNKDPGDVLDTSGKSGEIKLKAVWSTSSSTITLKSGFNDSLKSEVTLATGSKYILPECSYYQPGGSKVFSNWKIGGTDYLPGSVITIDGSLEATAVWVDAADSIKKEFRDGNIWMGTVSVSAITNLDNTSGWSYVGNNIVWDLSSDTLRNDDHYVGTLLGNIVANVSFSVNGLKSTTTEELPTIRITFERGGYLAYTDLVIMDKERYLIVFVDREVETDRYYDENTLLTRQLCENPTGANFNGWYLDKAYTNRYDYNMRVNSDMDGTHLYARYTYTVTLDNMNGTSYKIYVAQEDEGALLGKEDLPTPTYTGYSFEGWFKDRSLIFNWAYNSDRITEDTTLYAKWVGEEIRVNFWYYDNDNKLVLFGGVDGNGDAIPVYADDDDGKYDFDRAYVLNADPKVYPLVNYGSTFEAEDPWHGNKTILRVAQDSIKFTGVFVRWQVTSPIDEHQHIAVYEDTNVTTRIMYLPTEEDLEPYQGSLWQYYSDVYKDSFPRKGTPVEMLEINLVAETTTVAINIIMGLKESDEQFSSTITIGDPTDFLIYPYGPDLNNPVDSSGTKYYGDYGHIFTKYVVDESHVYYKDENDDLRFYKREPDGIWTCIYESQATSSTDVGDHYVFIYKLNDAVRNGYVLASWNNDYVSVANALNPDPNLEREMHVWCDVDGYVQKAVLISKDVDGSVLETPLLVGSYTVSAKDANAKGEIILEGMDAKNDSDVYTVNLVHADGTTTSYTGKKVDEEIKNIPADTTGAPGKQFVHWMVRETTVDTTYTVRALDANWTNVIELVAIWKDVYSVETYDGNTKIAEKGSGVEGTAVDLGTYSKAGHEFTGWYTSSGLVYGSDYVISETDCDTKSGKIIKVYARWDNSKESTMKVSLVTKYVDNQAYTTSTLPSPLPTLTDPNNGYKHTGWQVTTGDSPRILDSNQYTPTSTDADDRNVIVLEAIWERLYSVTIDGVAESKKLAGEVIDLTGKFSASKSMFKVSSDYIVKGGSVNSKTTKSPYTEKYYEYDGTKYVETATREYDGVVDRIKSAVIQVVETKYKFYGWKTAEPPSFTDVSGTITHPGNTISPAANCKFYAVYDLAGEAHTETYYEWDGTGYTKRYVAVNDGKADDIRAETILYSNITYQFKGWYESATPPSSPTADVTMISPGADISSGVDHIYYAMYEDKGSSIFTMTYRANWTQLFYSVNLSQPNYGIVDAYLEPRDGVGNDTYISTWGQHFIYGDRIILVYSPQDTAGQFMKWVITGKHYIDSYTNSTATLVIQGDCSISVDVSNGNVVDLLLSFDGSIMDAQDLEYTKVLLHNKATGEYFEAARLDPLNGREHYTAKVPFGDYYELCIRYGQSTSTGRPLIGFQPYEEYAMVGNISVQLGEYSSFLFDILSSRFVSDINVTEPAPGGRVICDMSGNTSTEGLPDFTQTKIYGEPISTTQESADGPKIDTNSNVVIYEMVDRGGTEKVPNVIAQATKYIGIEHGMLQRLIALGYHINDPNGGTPPVVVSFGDNLIYSSYEGYPWYIGGNNEYKGGFLVAQNVNYAKELSSNNVLTQNIYLDWTKTGSPADIIVDITKMTSSKQFEVTVMLGDRMIHKQNYYVDSSKAYRSISMIDNYNLTLTNCEGGTYLVKDGDTPSEKRLYVELDESDTHKVTLQYSLAKYTYELMTEVPNQPVITYPGVTQTKDIELTLGTPIELPTSMEQGGVTSDIVRFTVSPYSAVYTHIDRADDKLVYTPVASDFDSRRAIVLQADWEGVTNDKYAVVFATKYGQVAQIIDPEHPGPNLLIPDGNNRITMPTIVGADGFEGWRIWASGSHPGDKTDGTSGVIVPIWEDISTDIYTVIFNSGTGGSGTMDNYVAKSGISYIVPNNGFTGPIGQHFLKWRMTVEDLVTDAYPGDVLNTSGIVGNITLEACWSEGTSYTVTLNPGEGGAGTPTSITLAAGAHYVLPTCDFTYSDGTKVFANWDVDSTDMVPGDVITVDGNKTVTAKWAAKESVTTKTIRYSYTTSMHTYDITFSNGTYCLPNNMKDAPEGKVFAGWNASVAYLHPGDQYTVRSTDSNSRIVIFEAVWHDETIQEQYAVIFASQYGHPRAVEYCDAHTILTLPGLGDGVHTFKGWRLWNGSTMAIATLFEATPDKATEPLNPTVTMIPFNGLAVMTFVTTIDEFSDGTKRFSYTSQSDRTVAQYWATSVQQIVKDFLHDHSTGDYICTGFSDGRVVFSDPLDEEYADMVIGPGDHIFVAQWVITDEVPFGYSSDSHANVTALMDAASSEAIPRDVERYYRVNTEVSINIQLDSGYMIDIDATRGELGYKLVKSFVYGDDGTQYYIQDGKFYQKIDNVWTEVAGPDHYYYKDEYDNKYELNDVTEVYRYEGSDWVTYKFESVAGKDGLFIQKYLTTTKSENENVIYQMIRAGTFYKGTILKCKVEGEGYPYEVYRYGGDTKGPLLYRIMSDGIVEDPEGKEVNPMFFERDSCTYDDWLLLSEVVGNAGGGYLYSTLLTKCDDPVLGFFKQGYTYVSTGDNPGLFDAKGTKHIGIGPFKDESGAAYDGGDHAYILVDGKYRYYDILSISEDRKILYSIYDGYLSSYDCIEDNGKYYQGTPFVVDGGGIKYRDNYGNIWATSGTGASMEYYVQDQYIYTFSLSTNSEDYYHIHYETEDSEPKVQKWEVDHWTDVAAVIPDNYYFKDSYSNYFIGNNLVKGKVSVLYVDGTAYGVHYTDVNDVIKELYLGEYSESNVVYGITKDGSVLKKVDGRWISSDKIVYLDQYGNREYRNDYSMVVVSARYNNDHEYTENNNTYHEDTFGNVYLDWLGSPVELSDGRGYTWTFLLQDDLYLRIYTKPITYNVYFIVNGELVDPLGVFSVSTIDTADNEYYGTDIPKYRIVAFDGYLGQNISWYTDANYTNEYTIKGDARYIRDGGSEKFLNRTYQFYAVGNISLYAHMGNYVVNVHSYDDTQEVVQYSLTADNNDNIVLPTYHYDKEGYAFVGWALKDHHGMRFYTYAPGETVIATDFGVSATDPVTGMVELYPFYLSDGSVTKYYDGKEYLMEIDNDLVNQHSPFDDVDAITVRYSDQPIADISESDNDSGMAFKHVTNKTVYYCIEIKTRYNELDNKYGNTMPSYTISGGSLVAIKRVDAYAIAPTVHLTDDKDSTTEISVSIDDIHTVNLAEGDYTIYWATMDGDGNRAKSSSTGLIELSDPGSINTYAWVEFSDEEKAYASIDYNLMYIDGTILIYPYDSSKDENVS